MSLPLPSCMKNSATHSVMTNCQIMRSVYEYDDTYRKIMRDEVLCCLPKYLKTSCFCYDETDEHCRCYFYRTFLVTQMFDRSGKVLDTFENVSCIGCIEKSVCDDLIGLTAGRKIGRYQMIPENAIIKACVELETLSRIVKDSYLFTTVVYDEVSETLSDHRFHVSTGRIPEALKKRKRDESDRDKSTELPPVTANIT